MSKQDTWERLLALGSGGIKLGLDRVRRALGKLGDPHVGRRWIVVAGTNGKGSTSRMLDAILRASGVRVGLYTSPHLVDVRERIRVDGEMIGPRAFQRAAERVLAVAADPAVGGLTFFEALTCIAFLHFEAAEVDYGVLEVGLGGRLDAVNVVTPTVAVITPVALDHREYLGEDVMAVAREKAGILRPAVPLAVAVDDDIFDEVIGPRVLRERIPTYRVGRDIECSWRRGLWSYRGGRIRLQDVTLGLPGRLQSVNAALAVATVEHLWNRGLAINEDQIRRGLVEARALGRFQVLARRPPFVLDVAHNPHGIGALVESLEAQFPDTRYRVVFAAKRDKDIATMLQELGAVADSVVVAGNAGDGLASRDEVALSRAMPRLSFESELGLAVEQARQAHERGEAVLVTGSHKLVGEALARL